MRARIKKQLNLFKMDEEKMSSAKAGQAEERFCCCACAYADNGGSSTVDNADANIDGGSNGLRSPECD